MVKKLAFLTIASVCLFFFVPKFVGSHMNALHPRELPVVSEAGSKIHRKLFTADMHADSLLWERDLLKRSNYGHVDLPRMLAAKTGLQVFSVVTKTPRFLNFEHNDDSTDNITLLAIAQRWPIRTWRSRTERAVYQARRLHNLSARANGKFFVLTTKRSLEEYLQKRESGASITAGLLAIEGMHALDGELENLSRLYAIGYRMMGITHFFDNAFGGSAHGVVKGGLSRLGRNAVSEMERLGIIVDLAHGSPLLIAQVLEVATQPVVVSHTGVKGTCDRTRNLDDEQLTSIASNGGLVGIAFFSEAVCDVTVTSIAAAIRYTVDLIGINHVALGSDFDGAVTTPFDIGGLAHLTDALLKDGFTQAEIAAIMGGNLVALLRRSLPSN
jgi:membrane dipeptidase